MSSFTMPHPFWNTWALIPLILLAVLALVLLIRRQQRAGKETVVGDIVIRQAVTNPMFPGIDPTDYATAVVQQEALDRLNQLPQFRRLSDGTMIEWGSGARIEACDCSRPPVPHLMISWSPRRAQSIVSKSGLAHYVAYQERVAAVLLASKPILSASDETGEAH